MRKIFFTAMLSLIVAPLLSAQTGVEAEVYSTSENGTTYRVYVTFENTTDELIAIYGTVGPNQNAPLTIETTSNFFNPDYGSNYGDLINPAFFGFFPALAFDSWLAIGSEDNSGSGGVSSVGMDTYYDGFNNGSGFTVETFTGASWFVIPGVSADAIAGDDLRVLVAQLTTDGVVTVLLNVQSDDESGNTTNLDGLALTFPELPSGCMDELACNYDDLAEVSDGSCYSAGESCEDGDANTINDAYSDDCNCVGETVVEGCTEASACNYDATANSNAGCIFIGDSCNDGDAATFGDAYSADCVCEGQLAVLGCTDMAACNYDEAADQDDDSCAYVGDSCDDDLSNTIDDAYQSDCSCSGDLVPTGPAGLEAEVHATSEDGTTYRVYATFDSPTNELVAVYGTVGPSQNAPLTIETTSNFFNPDYGSNYGDLINPAFFGAFPALAFDSWLAIGSENSNGSGGVGSVGMDPYYDDFNNGSGFTVNTFTGGSWFIVPGTSADAISGEDQRVLVAQLTTDGILTLVMNFQYDDEAGNTYNTEGLSITFPELEGGCMDVIACNYDNTAEVNDGTCMYPGDTCNDGNPSTMNDVYNGDCACAGILVVEGCMDSTACNYTPAANVEDDSCLELDECDVCGGDGIAPGTCDCDGTVPDPGYGCNGVCVTDTDNDGICDELEIAGCTDLEACNYDSEATDENGSCTYPEEDLNCDGSCVNDLNENNVCDELEIFGCTAETADNYDPEALTDNGTCEWLDGLVQGLEYEVFAEDGVEGMTTYRVYAAFASNEIEITAMYGTDPSSWEILPSTSFYQDELGGPTTASINPLFFVLFPSLEFDSWVTLGAVPGEEDVSGSVGMEAFYPSFEAGGALDVNTFLGGSLYLVPGTSTQAIPVDGRVLIAQITTDGSTDMLVNLQIRDPQDNSIEITGMPLTFPMVETSGVGCTDSSASNYDPEALLDDGSCEYPEPSYTGLTYELVAEDMPEAGMRTFRVYANFDNPADQLTAVFAQDGNPINIATTSDFYQNEVGGTFASEINPFADQIDPDVMYDSWFTIGGENNALNLSMVGTDAAAAVFAAGGDFVVDNELGASWFVLPDLEPLAFPDENGRVLISQLTTSGEVTFQVSLQYRSQNGENPQILDELLVFPNLIFGCTDMAACNYDPAAEVNTGDCQYPAEYYDCDGACLNDADDDGVCDELEVEGCTNSEADNYNADATDDDGTCQYMGCTNDEACNYDQGSNTDDGSCEFAIENYGCDGECLNDIDGDGICDELEIPGCTDEEAANFNADATNDDGSCEYPGCTNPNAENYDPLANVDDGSCLAVGCTYSNANNFDPLATIEDGSCTFLGCTDEVASNYCPLALTDDGSCTYDVLGCTYEEASNYNSEATVDDGSCLITGGEDDCPFDVDGNGLVGSADLLEFLAAYSYPCP